MFVPCVIDEVEMPSVLRCPFDVMDTEIRQGRRKAFGADRARRRADSEDSALTIAAAVWHRCRTQPTSDVGTQADGSQVPSMTTPSLLLFLRWVATALRSAATHTADPEPSPA